MPRRSVIRSQRVCLDAAFAVFKARAFKSAWSCEGGVSRWSWADSSPQAGHDWFQCKEVHALNRDLPGLAAAVDRLIDEQEEGGELSEADRSACNRTIATTLHLHMKVPMAKGEGHSGTEHLASCFAMCNFWEAGSLEGLERACAEHVSFTSDMGTDSGIRGFRVRSVADVLPRWLRDGAVGATVSRLPRQVRNCSQTWKLQLMSRTTRHLPQLPRDCALCLSMPSRCRGRCIF